MAQIQGITQVYVEAGYILGVPGRFGVDMLEQVMGIIRGDQTNGCSACQNQRYQKTHPVGHICEYADQEHNHA